MKKVCDLCGKTKNVFFNRKNQKLLCEACQNDAYRNGGMIKEQHELPPAGQIVTDQDGKPICHICGRAYDKLMTHVWQRHEIDERTYKEKYDLEFKGIVSEKTKAKHRKATLKKAEICIKKNLIEDGRESRFGRGESRPRRLSRQTLLRGIGIHIKEREKDD